MAISDFYQHGTFPGKKNFAFYENNRGSVNQEKRLVVGFGGNTHHLKQSHYIIKISLL